MLKTWFPASQVGEAVKTWVFPRSFLNAIFLPGICSGAACLASGSHQHRPLPGTEGCWERWLSGWALGGWSLGQPRRSSAACY